MMAVLKKIWPQSLFARLLWVWLMGLTLVLAAAAWLALDERTVRGQVVLHAKLTQELAASADWLDTLSPGQREQWLENKDQGKRRERWRLEPPKAWSPNATPLPPHVRPLAIYLASELASRQPVVQHFTPLHDRQRHGEADGHHPERSRGQTWVSLLLADGA